MAKNYYDITIAFAGVNQAARMVNELAQTGLCDSIALQTMLNSITITNPSSVIAVYGEEKNLQLGLETFNGILNAPSGKTTTDILRYCGGIIRLTKKLLANPQALSDLSNRISQIERQLQHFSIDSENIIGALSDIYVDIISPLGPKIQVMGAPDVLQRSSIQAKVRAILLAGVRSAVLWRQIGGSQFQLFFARRHLTHSIQQALNSISPLEHK